MLSRYVKHGILSSIVWSSLFQISSASDIEIVTESWPSCVELVDGEVSSSITRNVLNIVTSANMTYSLSIHPWPRSFHIATRESNKLIYPIYKTSEREKHFHWFCPIYPSIPIYLFKRKDNPVDHYSFDALKAAVIGVERGDNSFSYFKAQGFTVNENLYIMCNAESNLTNLKNRRVDVIAQSEASLAYRAKEARIDPALFEKGMQIHPDIQNAPCMAMSLFTSDGLVERLRDSHSSWLRRFHNDEVPSTEGVNY